MSRIIRTSSGVKFPSKEDIFLDEQAKIAASKKLSMLAREKKEQAELRQEYLAAVRKNLRAQLNNIDIQEKDGSVVNLGEKYGRKKGN